MANAAARELKDTVEEGVKDISGLHVVQAASTYVFVVVFVCAQMLYKQHPCICVGAYKHTHCMYIYTHMHVHTHTCMSYIQTQTNTHTGVLLLLLELLVVLYRCALILL